MKKLITILLLLVSFTSFGQYEKLLNGKNINPYNLILKDKFIWEGNEVYKDSLTYSQINGDSIRFRYLDSSWGNWYALNAFMENAHEADPLFKQWNRTDGINIYSKQVFDWDEKLDPFALETDITGGVLDADFTSIRVNGSRISIDDLEETYNATKNEDDVIKVDASGNWIVGSQTTSGGEGSGYISEIDNLGTGSGVLYDIYQDSILRARSLVAENIDLGIIEDGTEIQFSFNPENVLLTEFDSTNFQITESQISDFGTYLTTETQTFADVSSSSSTLADYTITGAEGVDFEWRDHGGILRLRLNEDNGLLEGETFQATTFNIENSLTQIWKDGSDNLSFKDANAGTYTLSDLIGVQSVSGAGSVEATGSSSVTVALDGDLTSPGSSKYYGTDGTSSKGWHDLPSGGLSLTDPNADRLVGWDDSANDYDWFTAGTGLYISGTNLNIDLSEVSTSTSFQSTDYFLRVASTDATNRVLPENLDADLLGSGAATDGYVLKADGSGNSSWEAVSGGTGDDVSIDGVSVTDPDFVSTGDIDFVNSTNTITANINANAVEHNMLNNNIISGQSALTSGLLDADEFLIYDFSFDEVKRMDVSVLKDYMQNNLSFSSPGGSDGDIQYNDNGTLGGFGEWTGNTMTVPGLFRIESLTPTINFSETDNNNWNVYGSAGRLLFNSSVSSETDLKLNDDGSVEMNNYGSGNITGTPTFNLQTNSDGKIIETEALEYSTVTDSIEGLNAATIYLESLSKVMHHAEVLVQVWNDGSSYFSTQIAVSSLLYNNDQIIKEDVDVVSTYEPETTILVAHEDHGTEGGLSVRFGNLNDLDKYYYRIEVKYHLHRTYDDF